MALFRRDRKAAPPARPATVRLDDTALRERLLAGDEAAFASLVDSMHARLVRVARAYTGGDDALADEVVQEAWEGVVTGLGAFEGRASLKTWIFRIVVNRAKRRAVEAARMVPFSALGPPEAPAVPDERFGPEETWADPPRPLRDEMDPERLLLQREVLREVQRAIDALPPNQRLVILLRDVEGLEPEEACHVLEVSESNQRVLLHRARSRVRQAVERYLGEE